MRSIKLKYERFVRALGIVLGLAGLVAIAAGDLAAQTSTGAVRGYVTVDGAAVSDAQVTARLVATNETRTVSTNSSGFYYLPGLRPGTYEVTVRRIGLALQTRTIVLPIGQTLDVNVATSQVATTLATVEVTSERSQETRTSEVGTNISRAQIENLPNFERNVLDLAKLVPGVSTQAVDNRDKFFASGGQPPEAVNVFVDGASYKNDVLKGGLVGQDASKGNPLPQGAIQEFRVLTQNYKAEYQKAASAVIVATTKSGSNEFEADAFAYGVNKSFVARDEFGVRRNDPRPNYQRLQAGASAGGPLMRDKLFFFGTYELNFRDEPDRIFLGGDSLRAPAAVRARLLPYLSENTPEKFREHLALGKLTWNPSETNSVEASYTLRTEDDFRGFGGDVSFESSENVAIDTHTGVLNWRHNRGALLNEFKINTQFFSWNPTGTNYGLIGEHYFGLLRIGGKDTEQDFKQRRISLRDDVTLGGIQLAGDHVFKTGVNVDFLNYDGTKNQLGNPVYRYRIDEQWSRPFEAGVGFGNPTITSDNKQVGAFFQDDWSIGRKLLLNLGIRWDMETNGINNSYVTPRPLADSLRAAYAAGGLTVNRPNATGPATVVNTIQQMGGIENYITTGPSTRKRYMKAFQPRLGASYDIKGDGSMVIFGGGGLYFDRNYWNTLFDEQYRRQWNVVNINFPAACAPGAQNCAVWDPRYFDPAQLRALAVAVGEPEVFLVKNDMVPPRTLQMSFGVRSDVGAQRVTLSYNGLRGRNYMNFIRGSAFGGGPNLPYNTVFIADDHVKTWYNSLQLQVQRPMLAETRWGGGLAYTLAKSEEQGQSQDIFWGFDDRYPTVADRPRILAPNDQRHSVIANAMVRLPAQFMFSTIINLASGIAVNGEDASRGFGVDQKRTYIFQTPGRPFLGIGRVFGYQNMDVRLEKAFALASRSNASLLVDVFNVFNSDNLGCYETQITPTGRADYGLPRCAGLGRRVQLGLRYGLTGNR